MPTRNPINPTDTDARTVARAILTKTRFGALAVTSPDTGTPYVARVAMLADCGQLLTLISTLATHTTALLANPTCAALIGEPESKGDPLTHPRMTLMCTAHQVDKAAYEQTWLRAIPKAKLYYNFSDFLMFRLTPSDVHLNGGFGKAYRLTAADIA